MKTFIDIFAGLGGFRIALEKNELKCVFSSEWDKYAQQTYALNFGELPHGDITKVTNEQIPVHDCLCAGFPCQAFSISGKQGGFNDTRGTLFFEITRIVKSKKPKVLFLENVKNLEKHDSGKTLITIKNVINDLGYSCYSKVLNSSYFGIPQHRERLYMVCIRNDICIKQFEFPIPTYEDVNLKDIIENDLEIEDYAINRLDIAIKGNPIIENNLFKTKILKPIRIGTINKGGQGERIYSEEGHAITLSAYGGGVASKTGAYLIDNRIRKLSERECLRAQGFPETYEFPENMPKNQIYKMCGNSVSIPVIERIFNQICLCIS
tara:strand:+ start:75 stop:1040 length:966 start_codon:yes stop_codon:yes gene_type:complete